jgi:hypothetical protein
MVQTRSQSLSQNNQINTVPGPRYGLSPDQNEFRYSLISVWEKEREKNAAVQLPRNGMEPCERDPISSLLTRGVRTFTDEHLTFFILLVDIPVAKVWGVVTFVVLVFSTIQSVVNKVICLYSIQQKL